MTDAAQRKAPSVVNESFTTAAVHNCQKSLARSSLCVVGDATLLSRPKVALFCSVACPGKLILETYDLAKRFRQDGVLVISGFHSPMEQECLRILLRSSHPSIWCLARGLYHRIPSTPVDYRTAVADRRLIMVTPFPDNVRQINTNTATIRNRLVADMAGAVVIAHAAPDSKMEALCRTILAAGKPLYTFDHPANANLIAAGARPITADTDWQTILAAQGSSRNESI